MQLLTLFVVFIYLIQNEWIVATIPTEIRPDPRFIFRRTSPLDCTQYSNDYEIISSFPFVTLIDPLSTSIFNTYAKMNADANIYYLNIANQISVPNTVFCLKFLQELYVRNTSFYEFGLPHGFVQQLPSEIARLASSLMHLCVFDTTVSHLPEQIGGLTRLIRLQLFNTNLVALPDSIGNLSSLNYLYLSNNQLTSLPTTIANMRSLRLVMLDNNPGLRSVQSFNGLPNLYNLRTSNCPIESLPLNLTYLQSLYMDNNNLTDLINIGTLGNNTTSNKQFDFNFNRIRFVPPQIRNVRGLYRLDLDNNELITLPTDIFSVTTLRSLYIRNNLFSDSELNAIVAKFRATNPSLTLYWSNISSLPVKTQ